MPEIKKNELDNSKITIDLEVCTSCKMCAKECRRILFENNEMRLAENHEDECLECGHCVAICPVNAITLKIHSGTILKELSELGELPSFSSFVDLVQSRRSIRYFKSKTIPKDIMEEILNLTIYSPTGHNQENVFFTVVQDPEILKKFSDELTKQVRILVEKLEDSEGKESLRKVIPQNMFTKVVEVLPSLKEHLVQIDNGREMWRLGAQMIIIHSPKDSLTLIENCSLAAQDIMLSAHLLGLGTCSLGFATSFQNLYRTISKIVKIPRNHRIAYSLAIGYPDIKYQRIPPRKKLKVKWM